MGFKLFFHFDKNEYLTNEVLTKVYEMKCEVDPKDPFSFCGAELLQCFGTEILWYPDKNVTTMRLPFAVTASPFHLPYTHKLPNFTSSPVLPTLPPPTDYQHHVDPELYKSIQMRLTKDYEVGQ